MHRTHDVSRSNPTHRSGFTLIEVLIVLAVVSILAGMAFPKAVEIQESMALESGAQQMMRELNLAQVRAIKENRSVGFLRLDAKRYRISGGETRQLADHLEFGSATPSEIRFASFGPPLTGPASVEIASTTLGRKRYVVLNASGYASLQ